MVCIHVLHCKSGIHLLCCFSADVMSNHLRSHTEVSELQGQAWMF